MMETIRKAEVREALAIKKLVDGFTELNMIPRPLSYIYENIRDFFVCEKDDCIIGCCALHVMWDDLAEVKSLAVETESFRQGVGSILVKSCLEEAKTMGVPRVFTLTDKPEFFEKQGFRLIDKNELPRKIWGECMECVKYPDCCEEALIIDLE
ncbi:N-acetyltransferase [Candidatus Altiarchaeota archaeon]